MEGAYGHELPLNIKDRKMLNTFGHFGLRRQADEIRIPRMNSVKCTALTQIQQ
jgi:hypothetical protein